MDKNNAEMCFMFVRNHSKCPPPRYKNRRRSKNQSEAELQHGNEHPPPPSDSPCRPQPHPPQPPLSFDGVITIAKAQRTAEHRAAEHSALWKSSSAGVLFVC